MPTCLRCSTTDPDLNRRVDLLIPFTLNEIIRKLPNNQLRDILVRMLRSATFSSISNITESTALAEELSSLPVDNGQEF